jgi:hypothetical protein
VTIWQSSEETSNAQRPTSNAQFQRAALHYSIQASGHALTLRVETRIFRASQRPAG